MKVRKEHIQTLKTYLSNEGATLKEQPNGQHMYTFTNGLIINVYDTSTVTIQGQCKDTAFKNKINTFIDTLKVD